MNRSRRERLDLALELLHRAESTIEQVCDEESDSLANMPENLQSSDRFAVMENAIDCLTEAIENVQEATRFVNEAKDIR